MTQLNQIYRCPICGNIVDVLHAGVGELVCCGKAMELLVAKTNDEGTEKHMPVIEKTENGVTVSVGSIPHPMEDTHFIEWIEIKTVDGKIGRKFLKPNEKPEAIFQTKSEIESARAYCNIHGLWQTI